MTAPRLSDRALLAWVAAAVAAFVVVAAVVIRQVVFAPILPAPDPAVTGPLPASTAAPAPLTPVELTARPHIGWGPR